SPPISVTTHCETYIDGAMKVTMTLGTGSVNSMYLEIPVKDEMAPLFHAIHGSQDIRHNPAYAIPPGNGDVWNSTMLNNRDDWRGNFKPYIWLGAEERGLAWFADNEEGWELDWGTTSDWPDTLKNGWRLFIREGHRLDITNKAKLGNNAVP